MASAQRVSDEPAFILHRYDWSESSLILEVFTRHRGRVAGWGEHTCPAVLEDRAKRHDVACHDRHAAGHPLEQHDAEALAAKYRGRIASGTITAAELSAFMVEDERVMSVAGRLAEYAAANSTGEIQVPRKSASNATTTSARSNRRRGSRQRV